MKIIDTRILIFVGIGVMFVSIVLMIFARSWIEFYLCYGVGYPLGIGIAQYPLIILCWEWFPDHIGFVTGLLMGCIGIGAFILSFMTTGIVNWEGKQVIDDIYGTDVKYFPMDIAANVPDMFFYLAIIWGVLLMFTLLTVYQKPKKEGTEGDVENKVKVKVLEQESVPYWEALMSQRFWYLCLMMFNGQFFVFYLASTYKVYGLEFFSDNALTVTGAVGSVCTGICRPIWGTLIDKYGFRKAYGCLLLLEFLTAITI